MSNDGVDRITADEAKTALRAAAFTIGEEYDGAGRTIVHCLAGPFGADWDLESALDEVDGARDIAWFDHILGHDLAVLNSEGLIRRFDVKRPERAS